MLRFDGAGVSVAGRVRTENEDSAFLGPGVALVADGVGGAAAGEVASATAAYVVSSLVRLHRREQPSDALRDAVAAAHDCLRVAVQQDQSRHGMATTLTALATDGTTVALAHLGDSRAYLVRDRRLVRLTRDHTLAQALIDEGRVTPEEAAAHHWHHVVTRALNASPESLADEPDLAGLRARPGDRLLLCTDGLTDLVPDARIGAVLGLPDPMSAAERLVRDALNGGGFDNVTCLVVDVHEGPRTASNGVFYGAAADPANLATPGFAEPASTRP